MPGHEKAQTEQEKNNCRKNDTPVKKIEIGGDFIKRSKIGRQ